MKPYVSIDIETTGLDPETCQVLEIGAVIDDGHPVIDELPMFHCFVDHGFYHGEPYALGLNVRILNILANRDNLESKYRFLHPGQVGYTFHEWLVHNDFDPKRVPAAGKNFANFDRPFLQRLLNFSNSVRFNHRSLDPAILYLNPFTDDGIPNMKTCMERAGITEKVLHEALDDAKMIVKLTRYAFANSRYPGGLNDAVRSK